MNTINGVSNNLHPSIQLDKGRVDKGTKFMETLKAFYYEVDDQLKDADQKAEEFAVGKRKDILGIMIANEKASINFKFLIQVRNQVLEAYREIMRMTL